MNKLLLILISVATIGVTLPALAGVDRQAVAQAGEANQAASQPKLGQPQEQVMPGSGQAAKCPPDKPVLQLDHGPRAQTSPYLNRLRWQRYEAQMRACAK